jgi:hypothetical protein
MMSMQKPSAERMALGLEALTRLEQLQSVLTDIRDNPREAGARDTANDRVFSSFESLKATIDFLDGFQPFRGEGRGRGLTRPLWDLAVALADLEDGKTHPMLRAAKTGHKGSSLHYQAVTAWAAIAMDANKSSGMSADKAAKDVADLLGEVDVSQGTMRNQVTISTVKGWRAELMKNKGAEHAQAAWDKWCRERRGATSDRGHLAQWAMGMLRSLVNESSFRISP